MASRVSFGAIVLEEGIADGGLLLLLWLRLRLLRLRLP